MTAAVAHCFAQPAVQSVDKVPAELANPLAPVTALSASLRSEFGTGPNDDTHYTLRLQHSFFEPLQGGSATLLRTILPLRSMDWPASVTGVGDLTLVPHYVPDVNKSLFVGYGAAFGIPTANSDLLGSGKWTDGPVVIGAKTGQRLTWGGPAQQVWSAAGPSGRASVSVTTVQPFVTWFGQRPNRKGTRTMASTDIVPVPPEGRRQPTGSRLLTRSVSRYPICPFD